MTWDFDAEIHMRLFDGEAVPTHDLRSFLNGRGIAVKCDTLTDVKLLDFTWKGLEIHYLIPQEWLDLDVANAWFETVRFVDAQARLDPPKSRSWAEILRRTVHERADIERLRVELLRRARQTGRTEED